MRYLFNFPAELRCASVYKHETDDKCNGQLDCSIQPTYLKCITTAGRNSCYDKAGLTSSYNKAGRSSYYNESGRIGILLRIRLGG